MPSILFVCTGNICRSPSAEAVMRQLAADAGRTDIHVDSAGTQAYHVGEAPDPRSIRHGLKRGYDMQAQTARQVTKGDFHQFDYIFALDSGHLRQLTALQPAGSKARLALLLEDINHSHTHDIPDPYYGAADGFETVLDLLETACETLTQKL